MGMEKKLIASYLGGSANRSGAAHSSLAAGHGVISEKKASVNIEHREAAEVAEVAEVAKVTSHDFGRKKDGLALVKNIEEKPSQSTI